MLRRILIGDKVGGLHRELAPGSRRAPCGLR